MLQLSIYLENVLLHVVAQFEGLVDLLDLKAFSGLVGDKLLLLLEAGAQESLDLLGLEDFF